MALTSQTTGNSLGARRNVKAWGGSDSPSQGYKGVEFAQAESPTCLYPHPPLQEFSLKVTKTGITMPNHTRVEDTKSKNISSWERNI